MKTLWEILIPASANDGKKFSLEHHQEWDKKARKMSGGLTILKTGKGQWISPDGKTFYDQMIPVRIYCTEEQMDKLIEFTIGYYEQKAVMAYEISRNVKIVYAKNKR